MWIKLEDNRLVNLDMLTDIVPDRNGGAQLLCAGVTIAHSQIVYQKVFIEGILEEK